VPRKLEKLTPKKAKRMERSLGDWCKATRKLYEVSQKEFAKMLCIEQSALSRVENYDQKLNAAQYQFIKNRFKLTIVVDCKRCSKYQ